MSELVSPRNVRGGNPGTSLLLRIFQKVWVLLWKVGCRTSCLMSSLLSLALWIYLSVSNCSEPLVPLSSQDLPAQIFPLSLHPPFSSTSTSL